MKETFFLEDLFENHQELHREKESVLNAFELMRTSFEEGGKLLAAGNGGSCADAEHIVGELMKGFVLKRPLTDQMAEALKKADPIRGAELAGKLQRALPAIALTGHSALSTAFANDVDPKMSYAQQVMGYGEKGDVFLGISTSGNAENVVYAAIAAKAKGMKVIGLTGSGGGALMELCDVIIRVPGQETYKIQELHLPVYHTLCLMLEGYFFGS